MADVDSIRARAVAASGGVWQRHGADVWVEGSAQVLLRGRDGTADVREQADRDAEFVAHARGDILVLLQLLAARPSADGDADEVPAGGRAELTADTAVAGRRPWKTVVAVVGPAGASEALCDLANEVGARLAQTGVLVVTGGLGGVMAAAARGAADAGGVVVGLLPGEDPAAANEHLSIVIPTGLGQARNALVVAAADAVIAIGGSWGTLSEIALADRTDTPVICISGWTVTGHDGASIPMRAADTPEQALSLLGELLGWSEQPVC